MAGNLDTYEKSQLEIQAIKLKVTLEQKHNHYLMNQRLRKQLCFLRNLDKNKERFKEMWIWEDDVARELKMKQEAIIIYLFSKERGNKKQLKDDRTSTITITIQEVQDPQPMFARTGKENPTLSLEDAEYDEDSEDDTDVDEPPPCLLICCVQINISLF